MDDVWNCANGTRGGRGGLVDGGREGMGNGGSTSDCTQATENLITFVLETRAADECEILGEEGHAAPAGVIVTEGI